MHMGWGKGEAQHSIHWLNTSNFKRLTSGWEWVWTNALAHARVITRLGFQARYFSLEKPQTTATFRPKNPHGCEGSQEKFAPVCQQRLLGSLSWTYNMKENYPTGRAGIKMEQTLFYKQGWPEWYHQAQKKRHTNRKHWFGFVAKCSFVWDGNDVL